MPSGTYKRAARLKGEPIMIAVLGTGRMGGAIGKRLSSLGYDIVFGSRTPSSNTVRALLKETGAGAKALELNEAIDEAETIILATPYIGMNGILPFLKNASEKIIVDVTNALGMSDDGLMSMVSETSSGEELYTALPDQNIVKALNTIGFHIISDPSAAGGPVTSMIAGENALAKKTISKLVEKMGFETVDVGPIRQSRYMEGMAALYLTPYLQGRMPDAFEYHLRCGANPKESKGVRAAG